MAYFKCAFSNSGATLTVECDSFMAGAIVTCSNGVKTLQGLCPSTSPYEVTFKIPEEGTWVVSTVVSGATYSTSVDIDFSFEASLSGFNWMRWLTEGGLDPSDYNDLSEVLADEKALRQLNLVHASVDYMASIIATHPDVETIIAEGLFAKWANHSDYALDKMEANAVLSDLMDDADLYGYGELIEDNGDYVPKGNVPVMTSNSAPYGMASASSVDSATYDAYKAFDGLDSTDWRSGTSGTSNLGRIIYKFLNPVEVTKVEHLSDGIASEYKVQYSDDGTNWTDVLDSTYNTIQGEKVAKTFSKNGFHLYWCSSHVSSPSNTRAMAKTLQFYGRELKVSVPTMTSNTAPYGEVIDSDNNANRYYVFGGFNDDSHRVEEGNPYFIGYSFKNSTVVSIAKFRLYYYDNAHSTAHTVYVEGSNDKVNWETLFSEEVSIAQIQQYYNGFKICTFNNSTPYKHYRIRQSIGNYYANQRNIMNMILVQFYGKDYSEKEFANDGSKWLYDHGVELEEMTALTSGNSSNVVEKKDNEVYMYKVGTNSAAGIYSPLINLSDYSLLRAKMGDKSYSSNSGEVSAGMLCVSSSTPIDAANMSNVNGYSDYYSSTTQGNLPNNLSLDVSSYNEGKYLSFVVRSAGNFTKYSSCTELWLE